METAVSAAEERLLRDGMESLRTFSSALTVESPVSRPVLAYIFPLNPRGFVVVSGDDRLPPVLAYSYQSEWLPADPRGNPLMYLIVTDLENRLANPDPEAERENRTLWAHCGSGEPVFPGVLEQWPPEGTTPTGGWLMENWHQGAPYNMYCPMDLPAGARSAAGCPAVAMAAIVNFRENTNGTRFDDSDDYYHNYHEYYWIDDDWEAHDFPSWPVLNGYMETIDALYSAQQPLSDQDKAALVYASGAACKQVYTAGVSGTFGVGQAYDAYIRFGFQDCQLLDGSSDSLYQKLSQNMMEALPAHLAVVDSGPSYGHNLVIDGYNTDEYYHLNFGWNGSYNGWYQFPLSGMPYSMNIIEGIILDIGVDPMSAEGGGIPESFRPVTIAALENPAAGPLSIELNATRESAVTVSAYSISGRLLGRIAGGTFGPGSHCLAWSTEGVPAGVCLIVAAGPWGTESIRVTVLR
jgi:hypothetical protein